MFSKLRLTNFERIKKENRVKHMSNIINCINNIFHLHERNPVWSSYHIFIFWKKKISMNYLEWKSWKICNKTILKLQGVIIRNLTMHQVFNICLTLFCLFVELLDCPCHDVNMYYTYLKSLFTYRSVQD